MNLQGGPASHPWFWPEADRAFYDVLKENLDLSKVRYEELPVDINDPRFAERAVEELDRMIRGRGR